MRTKRYIIPAILFLYIFICSTSCPNDSTEKKITSFNFNNLNPPISGTIDEDNKQIDVEVPELTDVTNLSPTIVISDKATINPISGTAQDYSNPVNYVVTAEDGSRAGYNVDVKVEGN